MPDVSIILLTKNGLPILAQSLAAIFTQKTGRTFEVIAVDSGSMDGTLELLARFPVRVKQIPPEEFNFGATRGLGYDLALGEFLVTLSQDAVPVDELWLEKLLAPFTDPTVAAVSGSQALPLDSHSFYWERIGRFYLNRGTRRWKEQYGFSFSNINSALRRTVWEQNRIGPVAMHEDRFLQRVWAARRLRMVLAREAKVQHTHRYTVRSLALRSENDGFGQRVCGQNYSGLDACLDLLSFENWRWWWRGLMRRELKTPAEILFPLIRPLFLWKGNHLKRAGSSR